MSKEYSNRLQSLEARRFDQDQDQAVLQDGFYNQEYPDVLKYALESMHPIDPIVSAKMFRFVRRTQDLIQEQLGKRDISVDARYVGAHTTSTHIELYGDLELFIILKSFEGKASQAVSALNADIIDVLTKAQAYNSVDNTNKHQILVQLRKPVCSLAIVPSVWISSALYKKSNIEINRGICEFNFEKKTRKVHLPFLNLARFNAADKIINGNLSACARLLRTLIKDSTQVIHLSDDEILGTVFGFSTEEIAVPKSKWLSMLPNISLELGRLISDDNYRMNLVSPGRMEYVFGKKDKTGALIALKAELDELIEDLESGIQPINKTILSDISY